MGRRRSQQAKLAHLDKTKSRRMKALCGAIPPAPAPSEAYPTGGYHGLAPVYVTRNPVPAAVPVPPPYPGLLVPPPYPPMHLPAAPVLDPAFLPPWPPAPPVLGGGYFA
ncbi:hypothetical protein V5799_020530 [Amblyomma americanum]|uniref:Uncharacterized protein n=1 Tax=Amblyomma americanum TaxID=6943 RepID=A0AAQ4EU69_AMBAM